MKYSLKSKLYAGKSIEKTHCLKVSYFVLPMPALHGFMVPRPSESDLETVKGNKL